MTDNCPWCKKPKATDAINDSLPASDPGAAYYCWAEFNGEECPEAPSFDELARRLKEAEAEVARLKEERDNLKGRLADCEHASVRMTLNIADLKAERDRLAEIVAAAEAARAKGDNP